MLSYGDADSNAISLENWPDNAPRLLRQKRVHSGGDISCESSPEIDEEVYATARGAIANLLVGTEHWPNTVDIRPIDWDRLLMEAEENGHVIHVSDFPERNPALPISDDFILDDHGNRLHPKGTATGQYRFVFHDGDHDGRYYYFSSDGAVDTDAINPGVAENQNAYHFTVASELPLVYLASGTRFIGGTLGGADEEMVTVYCRESIGSDVSNFFEILHAGVLYRTEGDFIAPFTSWSAVSEPERTFSMRAIAQGRIALMGSRYGILYTPQVIVHGTFAPPCGPAEIRMGCLQRSN